jgi:phosphoglucomutase
MAILGQLDPVVFGRVNSWMNGDYDETTKAEIQTLIETNNITELTDAFYRDLEFGTGGMRGIMGAGSNRVNKYTLGAATQGFANFFLRLYPDKEIKVVIAHDCRNNSSLFANIVTDVFTANGIKVYFFNGLRPTPELSFAIRHLGCQGGVMLTASHNPKEYNGYKAYGADGGQLVAPYDQNVLDEVSNVDDVSKINFERKPNLVEVIGEAIDEAFITELLKQSISKEAIHRQKNLSIVFSPIHGTGGVLVPPTLRRFGFENVTCVEEQMVVDGNFPTVIYPNPEEKEALTMAINKGKEMNADLVLATDPDADRVGMAIQDDKGEFILLNGNQAVSLLVQYVLKAWKKAEKLDGNQYVVKTIVTSNLIDKIASDYNVNCYNVLTGFKFIGELMTKLEGKKTYLAGGEESYGYLIGEHARDKDAIISCAMIAEMVAYYKDQGTSLYNAMLDMYIEYGYYREKLISLTMKGRSGADEIKAMMERFRDNTPSHLGGQKVVMLKDYKTSISKDLINGIESNIDLPSSNVLQFITEAGSIISARPSGTEPKIKFYCSIVGQLTSRSEFDATTKNLDDQLDQIMKDLGL